MITAKTGNDLYLMAIDHVLTYGESTSPRGVLCKEMLGVQLKLEDPSRSLITLSARKMAYKFCMAEKLCYITGNSGEDILPRYAKNIGRFINPNTGRFDGAYGPRLKECYQKVISLLQEDPDSRRAVISIYDRSDLRDSLDVPCTLSLQFLLRNNKLNLIVTMRSNDLLWGFPYDISNFTFIQECIAGILGVQPGFYVHQVGSFHIYDRDISLFQNILADQSEDDVIQKPVDVQNYIDLQEQAETALLNRESKYRLNTYFSEAQSLLHGAVCK